MRPNRVLFAALLLAAGCSPAERARYSGVAYLRDYKVTLYSGGKAVREWKTTGKVTSEHDSDGYFFTDAATGKLVEVTGDIVIEQD